MDEPSNLIRLQECYLTSFLRESGDIEGRLIAKKYLDSSTAIYHGEVVDFGFIPKLYDMTALKRLDTIAQMTYSILEKVTRHFLDDPQYRRLFKFSPELERLICLPTGYQTVIPIMRMDLFLDEDTLDFRFCEFNTDGASAMNEDREGTTAFSLTSTFKNVASELRLEPQELFEGWVDEFLKIYSASEQAVAVPRLAMIDYLSSATLYEFEEFRRRFEARGYECMICDMPTLEYRDGALYGSDVDEKRTQAGKLRIDAVYRRAVTGEVLEDLAQQASVADSSDMGGGKGGDMGDCCVTGAQGLIRAVEDKSICMIGGFITHVAHCKQLFTVLHLPETSEFLSDEENDFIHRHVPYTTRLESGYIDLNGVKEYKDDWIVKPEDGYGSKGVYAGVDYEESKWHELVDACSLKRYVVQKYCPQYATPNVLVVPVSDQRKQLFTSQDDFSLIQSLHDPTELEPWNILTGLYLYGGQFSGIYVRAGQKGIIVGFAGGITLPTFLAGYDPQAGLALRTRPLP